MYLYRIYRYVNNKPIDRYILLYYFIYFLYIKRILDGMNIKVTRLASGVHIGADMEYVDSLTLERSLSDRKAIE